MHCKILLVMLLLANSAAAAQYLMIGQVPGTVSPAVQDAIKQAVSVLDDARLRVACFLGSFGGAAVSTVFFPLGTVKQYASKLIGSACCGVLFSPKLLSWFNWELNLDNVVCMAGIVALLSWTVLQFAVPLTGEWLTKWFLNRNKQEP